jgi:hypothetical protein
MKMAVSRRLGAFAIAAIAAAGLSGLAKADFTFQSANRSVYAAAWTSYVRDGQSPISRGTTAYGAFHSGVRAWASGDFYSQSQAWQRSSLASDGIRIEMAADRSAGGGQAEGWFGASSQSLVTTQFTLTDRTPFWIIMDAPDYFGNGTGGSVTITGGLSNVSVAGTGSWDGYLDAGSYSLTSSMSASNNYFEGQFSNNVYGGWSSITIGVPAPATASALAAVGLLAVRRRRG